MFDHNEWMTRPQVKIMLWLNGLVNTNDLPAEFDIETVCSLGCQGISKEEQQEGFVLHMKNGDDFKVMIEKI